MAFFGKHAPTPLLCPVQATYFDSYTANADMKMKLETGQQHGRPTISGSVPGMLPAGLDPITTAPFLTRPVHAEI